MQLYLRKILILFFLLFSYVDSFSQSEYNKLSQIIKSYTNDDWSETINQGKEFLIKNPDYKGAELVYLYQMMILSYASERDAALEKNKLIKVKKLHSEMRPYVNKIISLLESEKLPDTWLGNSLRWNKKGDKWDSYRNQALDIYLNIIPEMNSGNQNSSNRGTTSNSSSVQQIYKSTENKYELRLQFENIKEIIVESEKDLATIDNFIGFYTLEDDVESIKRKNVLTKNSFLAYDNLMIKNFLIFKDSNQLFLVELNDKNNSSDYMSEIKKFVADKTKIQSFKNRFITPEHNWVYYSFLKNDGLYKYKRGSNEISKKWKTVMRKNHGIKKFSSVPSQFSNGKSSIYFNGKLFFSLGGLENDDIKIRSVIRKNVDLLMGISDYNYSGFENKFNDLKRNVFYTNFSLLDDLNKVSFKSIYENRISQVFSSNRKNIHRLSFDANSGLNTAYVKNSKLFNTRSYNPTFVRTISLTPGKLTVSAGKNFSYSEVSFKKHPNSEGIVKLFTQGYLNDGDMSSFENDLASIFEKSKVFKNEKDTDNEIISDSSNKIKNDEEIIKIDESFGQGKNYADALDNALRNAIDQTGAYVYSEFEVKAEEVTVDKMGSISAGYIKEYEVLEINKISENNVEVTISAIVTKFRNNEYFERKGDNIVVFDKAAFKSKLEEQDQNKLNEEQKILSLCQNEFDKFIKESITFTFLPTTPKKTTKNQNLWKSEIKVDWELNSNYSKFEDYFWTSLEKLALKENDLKVYNEDNTEYFKFGNIYLRSKKSINILSRFLSSVNYYPSNFYIQLFDKKYFPEGISYDRNIGKRVQTRSTHNFSSSDISIGGLVYFNFKNPNQRVNSLISHRINKLFTDITLTGKLPLNNLTKEYRINGNTIEKNLFLKNGKVDYRDIQLVNINADILVDFSSVKRSGTHKIIFNRLSRNQALNYEPKFYNNNRSSEVNYIYTSQKKPTPSKAKVSDQIETKFGVIDDSDGWSNVRSGKSTQSSILFRIYENQRFKILRTEGKWSYIDYNGRKGYMHNSVIKIDSSPKKTQASDAKTAKIIGDNIWVRNSPTNGDVVMYLENNTEVQLLGYCCNETIRGKNNYWYKIDLDGKRGWVFGSQLRFIDKKFDKVKTPPKKEIKDYLSSAYYRNIVSYWSFNGNINAQKGNSFYKSSSYSIDFGTDRFGNYNSSYNDSNQLSSSLGSSSFGNNDFSLSFWINSSSYGDKKIFKIIDSDDKYISVDLQDGEIILKLTTPGQYWGTNTNNYSSSNSISGNRWSHVLISFNFNPNSDDFSYRVFVNGRISEDSRRMLNSTNFKPTRLETSSINSLNLDDVSFWKNVFSNSDYNYLYNLHRSTDITRAESTEFSN